MTKKNKRRNKKEKGEYPLSKLEIQAMQEFSKKSFKNAKALFEKLCKYDKDKYLSYYLKCCNEIIDYFLKVNELNNAKKIIMQAGKITDEINKSSLFAKILLMEKNYSAASYIYIDLLLKNKKIECLEESTFADVLILAFEDFTILESDYPDIYKGINTIYTALEYVCSLQYEKAIEEIKSIGIKSIFAHWKLFIKGLICFYKKEDAKAVLAFQKIPSKSLIKSTVQAYIVFLDEKKEEIIEETILKQVCHIAGYSNFSSIIPKADYLWQKKLHKDSYKHVCKNLINFPIQNNTLTGILSEFYFNSIFYMTEPFVKKYFIMLKNGSSKNNKEIEMLLILRIEAMLYQKAIINDPDDYEDINYFINVCFSFLEKYKQIYGNNEKLEGIFYAYLGFHFSELRMINDVSSIFSFGKPEKIVRDEVLAEKYLIKSIALYNSHKESYLKLLELYENTKQKSKQNVLLDKLIKIFPNDSNILNKSGMGCIQRKAYVKGIKYLETAVALDTLNSMTKNNLAYAYLKSAYFYFINKQIKKGREIYEKALQNCVQDLENFNRNEAYIYARWSALEYKSYNNNIGDEKFKKILNFAMNKKEDFIIIIYFTYLIFKAYRLSDKTIKEIKKDVNAEFKKTPSIYIVILLLKQIEYINNMENVFFLKNEKKIVAKYAQKAIGQPCSRLQAEFIILWAKQHKEHSLAEKYIKKMLKEDRNDPLFLFLEFKVNQKAFPNSDEIEMLDDILSIAKKRNYKELIREIEMEIKAFNDVINNLNDFEKYIDDEEDDDKDFPFFNDDDHDDDDDDDDDEFEDIIFGKMPVSKKIESVPILNKKEENPYQKTFDNLIPNIDIEKKIGSEVIDEPF